MHDEQTNGILAGLALVMTVVSPYAAIGAAFGCVFFLQYPSILTGWRKTATATVSWAIGYGVGMYFYGDGPPWMPDAFLPALIGAAVGCPVVTAALAVIDENGDLPPWLVTLIKLLPWRK